MKPNKPGCYTLDGKQAIVAMCKGVLVVVWVDADGELKRDRVWSAALKNAVWSALVEKQK